MIRSSLMHLGICTLCEYRINEMNNKNDTKYAIFFTVLSLVVIVSSALYVWISNDTTNTGTINKIKRKLRIILSNHETDMTGAHSNQPSNVNKPRPTRQSIMQTYPEIANLYKPVNGQNVVLTMDVDKPVPRAVQRLL